SNWRNCHLPRENRDVSASAKKKLAAKKTTTAAMASHTAIGVIPGTLDKKPPTQQPKRAGSLLRAFQGPLQDRLPGRVGGVKADGFPDVGHTTIPILPQIEFAETAAEPCPGHG